jgi:hypothetical protein
MDLCLLLSVILAGLSVNGMNSLKYISLRSYNKRSPDRTMSVILFKNSTEKAYIKTGCHIAHTFSIDSTEVGLENHRDHMTQVRGLCPLERSSNFLRGYAQWQKF